MQDTNNKALAHWIKLLLELDKSVDVPKDEKNKKQKAGERNSN